MVQDEFSRALAYLRERGFPEDAWILGDGQQWFKVSEVADPLGLSTNNLRTLAEQGKIPGAVLHGKQTGWRLPRSGIVIFLARLRQEQEARGNQQTAG
jgi:Helix-turn-helix domain